MNREPDELGDKQIDEAKRVGYLVAGYLQNTLTEAEKDELDVWVTASDENMRLFVKLTDEKNIERGLKERGIYDADKAVERLKQKIAGNYLRPVRRIRLLASGIAASVILLVGLFLLNHNQVKPPVTPTVVATSDVAPGSTKATLTLADGRSIALDRVKGTIAGVSGAIAVNKDGGILYTAGGDQATLPVFNTVSTPRGGQYQLTLSDGSKVWLNAASWIKFPTAFTSNERTVEMTGEAYFEVKHDPGKPFLVKANGSEVEVLGTHFNVNAYEDEEATKVSLLEGSVRAKNNNGAVTIKPGQQAVLSADQAPSTVDSDLEEVIAWKNGFFEFNNAPIEDIMKQVERWYNVTVKYEAKPSYHFNASIKRDAPVSKLFHLLELTDQVHFSIDRNTIIVKQ